MTNPQTEFLHYAFQKSRYLKSVHDRIIYPVSIAAMKPQLTPAMLMDVKDMIVEGIVVESVIPPFTCLTL